jgi:hypothetical protein
MEFIRKIIIIFLCLASAALLQLLAGSFLMQLGVRTYTDEGFKLAMSVEKFSAPWAYGRYLLPFTALGVYWFLKKTAPDGEDVGSEDPC